MTRDTTVTLRHHSCRQYDTEGTKYKSGAFLLTTVATHSRGNALYNAMYSHRCTFHIDTFLCGDVKGGVNNTHSAILLARRHLSHKHRVEAQ